MSIVEAQVQAVAWHTPQVGQASVWQLADVIMHPAASLALAGLQGCLTPRCCTGAVRRVRDASAFPLCEEPHSRRCASALRGLPRCRNACTPSCESSSQGWCCPPLRCPLPALHHLPCSTSCRLPVLHAACGAAWLGRPRTHGTAAAAGSALPYQACRCSPWLRICLSPRTC